MNADIEDGTLLRYEVGFEDEPWRVTRVQAYVRNLLTQHKVSALTPHPFSKRERSLVLACNRRHLQKMPCTT